MIATLTTYIADLDPTVLVGLVLMFLAACMVGADRIAKLGQPVEPTRSRPTSSNRKAGRSR